MAKLRVTTGKSSGKTAEFDKTAIIGRGETAQVQINDIKASREHCKVFEQNGQWVVADLNSRNGIKVNGIQTTRKNLSAGDVIEIGETQVVFELAGAASRPAAAAPKSGSGASAAAGVDEIEIEEEPASASPSRPSAPAAKAPSAPSKPAAASSQGPSKKEAAMAEARAAAAAAAGKGKAGAKPAPAARGGATATKEKEGLQVSDRVLQFSKVDTKHATLMDVDLSQSTGGTQLLIWAVCLGVLGLIVWLLVVALG